VTHSEAFEILMSISVNISRDDKEDARRFLEDELADAITDRDLAYDEIKNHAEDMRWVIERAEKAEKERDTIAEEYDRMSLMTDRDICEHCRARNICHNDGVLRCKDFIKEYAKGSF